MPERAEAVFIGGNGLRAVGVIKALEEALNRPVLTANQVAFWQALVLMGIGRTDRGLRPSLQCQTVDATAVSRTSLLLLL